MPIIKMTEQEYMEKTGSQPKPLSEAVSNALMSPQQTNGSWASRALADAPSDISGALSGVSQRQTQRAEGIATRQVQGQNPFSTGLQHLGNAAATGLDAAITGTMTGVKLFLTPEQEQKATEVTQQIITNAQTNPTTAPIADGVKSIVSQWNEFKVDNPEAAANLEAGGNIVDALTLLTGVGAAKNLPKEAFDAAGDVIKTTVTKADDLAALRRASQLESQTQKASTATAKIVQGKTQDVPTAMRAFTESVETPTGNTIRFDTKEIKTFSDVDERLTNTVKSIQDEKERYLSQFDTKFNTQQLGRFETTNGRPVVSTPVSDALEQMETYYKKTSQAAKLQEVKDLKAKMDADGLTVAELDKIARDHGKNLNAFNVNGELASGLPRQAAENTRQGVKEVLRERLPDDYARQLDSYQSDLLSTERLVEKVVEKAQKQSQKLKDRSVFEQAKDAVFEVMDLATLRSVSSFSAKFAPGSQAKYPTMSALELQDNLPRYFKELERLSEIQDAPTFKQQLEQFMGELKGGMSINPVKLQELKSRRDEVYAQMVRTQDTAAKKRLQTLHQELEDQVRKMESKQ